SGPNPVKSSAIGRAAITVTARSGSATTPTASAYDAVSDESRPASRALASDGRTVTRTAVAASARTMKTPDGATKPSVSAVRPSFRAMTTATTAASPVCTAIPTAVTVPVTSDPRPVRFASVRTARSLAPAPHDSSPRRLAFGRAGSRYRRCWVPRLASGGAPRGRRTRRRGLEPSRPRPDVDGGHSAALRRDTAGARLPPRGRGRGHRGEPGQPRPLLVREPDDGRACARAGPDPCDTEARDCGDDLRLPEVRPGPLPRGRPLERLPGGDERALRRRQEGRPGRRAGLPRAVRDERDLPASRQPLRPR